MRSGHALSGLSVSSVSSPGISAFNEYPYVLVGPVGVEGIHKVFDWEGRAAVRSEVEPGKHVCRPGIHMGLAEDAVNGQFLEPEFVVRDDDIRMVGIDSEIQDFPAPCGEVHADVNHGGIAQKIRRQSRYHNL